ncbi:endonuclease domain-containing protein [Chelatococcus reniformis]|nr:DUF559 domain-containing protein [Chelatococcus reniformis]
MPVTRARTLRRQMTPAERKLWHHLKRIPLAHSHFRRQAPIGRFVVDFVCHEAKLVVDLDGGHHETAAQAGHDVSRTMALKADGYRVLQFWNREVLQGIESFSTRSWRPSMTEASRAKRCGGE